MVRARVNALVCVFVRVYPVAAHQHSQPFLADNIPHGVQTVAIPEKTI